MKKNTLVIMSGVIAIVTMSVALPMMLMRIYELFWIPMIIFTFLLAFLNIISERKVYGDWAFQISTTALVVWCWASFLGLVMFKIWTTGAFVIMPCILGSIFLKRFGK